MKLRRLFAIATLAICATACVTKSLWKATDPTEYVEIPQSEISESELRQQGLHYRRDDEHRVYYVEKSSLRRLGDYSIRFFATPVTVALDAGPGIVVVGTMLGIDYLATHSGGTGLEYSRATPQMRDAPRATPVWYPGTATPTAVPTPR